MTRLMIEIRIESNQIQLFLIFLKVGDCVAKRIFGRLFHIGS
uniref:Uncharacterized protein n=1 Tax=Rhizophora mucronata TaxID=61149 RepID=A0A2P2NJE5_RHIMU